MKIVTLLASLILIASFAEAKNKRYLVQFKSSQGFLAMENYFDSNESTLPLVQKSLTHVKVLVIKTENRNFLSSLKNHPEVLSVDEETFYPTPKPVNGFRMQPSAQTQNVNYFENVFKISALPPTSTATAETPVLKKGPQTPWGILAVNAGEAWSLSEAGARARVLVLDTGVDPEHPSIAANFEKGRNFTENSAGEVPEADFIDTEGHGTHVAGTVLGVYNPDTGFTGVAPKAKLLMGKVCSSLGCSSIAIVEGINWGIQEKVDVISMSLGGPNGASAERTATANAEKAGIIVIAASGNGADAPTYSHDKAAPICSGLASFFGNTCGVSFPAAFSTVYAVGALNDNLEKTKFSQWGPELDITAPGAAVISAVPRGSGRISTVQVIINGQTKDVLSSAFSGTELFSTPLVNNLVNVPGVGKPEEFAQVNVEGKFALVRRGDINFLEKVKNAIDAKAVGVVIYNNTAGLLQGSLSEDGSLIKFPVVMVEQATGDEIVAELAKGITVEASMSLAPSDYASFDGTSMATPHVAGVAALIKSANKNLSPAQVRLLMTATAKTLAPNETNQLGAGIVQADAAVKKAVGQ
jgi:serine protease